MKIKYCYAVLLALCFVGQAQAMDLKPGKTQADEKQEHDHEQPEPDRPSSERLRADDQPADGVRHNASGANDAENDNSEETQLRRQLAEEEKKRERQNSLTVLSQDFIHRMMQLARDEGMTDGTSNFSFADDKERKEYFENLLLAVGFIFEGDKDIHIHSPNTTKLETFILGRVRRDLIVIDERDFCGKTVQEGAGRGARVINPHVNSLLQALRNIAQQAPALKPEINQQARRGGNQHNKTPSAIQNSVNEAMARESEALFEHLKELVLQHNQSRVQEDQGSKPAGWGWKGHLLTATVASAVTLGAVYAGLRFSNHKLVSATA